MPRIGFIAPKSGMAFRTCLNVASRLAPAHKLLALQPKQHFPVFCYSKHRADFDVVLPYVQTLRELEVALEYGFSILDVNWTESGDVPIRGGRWLDLQYQFDLQSVAPDAAVQQIVRDVVDLLPDCHNPRRFPFPAGRNVGTLLRDL